MRPPLLFTAKDVVVSCLGVHRAVFDLIVKKEPCESPAKIVVVWSLSIHSSDEEILGFLGLSVSIRGFAD
jgi:hypothetical protein